MNKTIGLILLSTICFAFTTDLQRKVIRGNGFDIECFVSPKKLTDFDRNKMYFWYKSGEIHQSLSTTGGYVLHKIYSRYHRSNQLIEKGEFSFGLKIGTWKTWHKNGKLKSRAEWRSGFKNGTFKSYDSLGNLIINGNYKNNLKHGYWIDFINKDTTYYKNNLAFNKKPKNLVGRLLRKRDSLEIAQIKTDRIIKRKTDSIKRAKLKLKRLDEKRNDSIKKAKKKLNKLVQKKNDSIKGDSKKQTGQSKKSFFDGLFKKNGK